MSRQKGPGTREEVAAYIAAAGGVHLHHYVINRNRQRHGWTLTFGETDKCFSDQCFVMRLKNVEKEER